MYQIGLSEIRSHLCQHFFIGDADVDGKSEGFPYAVLDPAGGGNRVCVMGGDRSKIHIAFIHTDLFDIRADVGKVRHQ